MSLAGKWAASNGGQDIFIVQSGIVLQVNWTQDNPYWNEAAGIVKDNQVKMSFGSGDQQSGNVSADGNTITWGNNTSWSRVS